MGDTVQIISPIDGSVFAECGAGLSKIGYKQLTRPMSFHLKTGS